MDTILDILEVALSSAYARWLNTHKGLEPKMTWAEVVFGVAYTLIFSTVRGAVYGGSWWDQTKRIGRDFMLSGTPIIVGEICQAIEARRDMKRFEARYEER